MHLPLHDVATLTEAFRRAVLKLFVKRELMDLDTAHSMLAWPHSGFHAHDGVWVTADDMESTVRLAKTNGVAAEEPLTMVDPEPEALRKAKHRWAELLRRIMEVDPLRCPRCGETTMRIVAFITQPKTVDRILHHLRRTRATRRCPRAPPRRWKSTASTASV